MTTVKTFSDKDIEGLLSMPDAIDVCESALQQLWIDSREQNKSVALPERAHIVTDDGITLVGPAYVQEQDKEAALGLKFVAVRTANAEKGLPTIPAVVLMADAETGVVNALMNATFLTVLRTGALSGVATRHLARKDAKSLVVFGAGNQAWSNAVAVCCERDIEKISIVNQTTSNAEKLVQRLTESLPEREIEYCIVEGDDIQQAVEGADVIVTATNASEPLFHGEWITPGTHLNCIGSYRPTMQEVDEETIVKSRIVVDTLAAVQEAGDLLIPEEKGLVSLDTHVLGVIGKAIAGDVVVRESDDDITLFKSCGSTLFDVAVGKAVLEKSEGSNIGGTVSI